MNVFACDLSPHAVARALADRHVIKMCLESAQLLSTAARAIAPELPHDELYKAAYVNHPVTRWVLGSDRAREWTMAHGMELAREYHRRFGRVHASATVIGAACWAIRLVEPHAHETPALAFCGPEDLVPTAPGNEAVVAAYRALLARKYAAWTAEGKPPKWTNASKPAWLEEA